MDASLDAAVRTVAIEKLRGLAERYAHRIPRASLMEGVVIDGQRVPLWNPQQGIFKPAIFGKQGAALTVQTSVKSPYDDSFEVDAGVITYSYRGTDANHPDNLALRNAMLRQLPLIYLFAVDPGVYDAIAPVFVVGDDPTGLRFTLMADQAGALEFDATPAARQIRREYATRSALVRLHQHQFRRMVLIAYRQRCSICHLRHVELLDAAHILADHHPKGEPVVPNGLGLCKIHHAAYDANIIGIDADTVIHVREDILAEQDGPMLLHGLQSVNGSILDVPRNPSLKPNPEFLAERFDEFRAA